ncbi:MAG TPA: AmmeMemoRadiSam system protein A [Kofleriaceae bacterium]
MSVRGFHLVRYARASLRAALGGPAATPPQGEWCTVLGATFVTLRWQDGDLQGCIGSLEADRPIVEDVAHNAVAAGTRDPRTQPCKLADVDKLDVALSILSPLELISSETEIRIGTDGVVLVHEFRRATFLPVMWERLRDTRTFMRELRRKAGLPRDFAGKVQLMRYTVEHFEDKAPGAALEAAETS